MHGFLKCDFEYPDNVQACSCVSLSLRTVMRVFRVGRCGCCNDTKRSLLCVESEVLASGGSRLLRENILWHSWSLHHGLQGLGALWQLPQLRTCPCRIPVLLHLSRSRACVNLERASRWQGRSVHAIPTQTPQNHKSSPFKVPFTTRMCSLLLHGEPGLFAKKEGKKNWREKPELATD